jgi:hypothetical protein
MSGCEGGLACHSERSEGSAWPHAEILRCAQDDTKGGMTRLISKYLRRFPERVSLPILHVLYCWCAMKAPGLSSG